MSSVKWVKGSWGRAERKKESEVTQLCLTLCDPMDCSPPGSSIHRVFQAKILEWVAISFSKRPSWPRDWTQVFRIIDRHFTIWTTREAHWQVGINPWQGFCHKPYEVTMELQSRAPSLASHRACHTFTQAHCRVSEIQQKTCSLGEWRTRVPSILTLFWRILDKPPRWKVAAEPQKTPGFLASRGEFNLGPVMRLDGSELLCNKILLKYKRDRESFWHRHQKRQKEGQVASYCYGSVTKLYLTVCNPMDCSTPGFSVLHYLPEFAQT